MTDIAPDFDGETYSRPRDQARLSGQLARVFDLMKDGRSRTLGQIVSAIGGSEAGVSARLRDLRKLRFGGHTVERTHAVAGLWYYTLKPNPEK